MPAVAFRMPAILAAVTLVPFTVASLGAWVTAIEMTATYATLGASPLLAHCSRSRSTSRHGGAQIIRPDIRSDIPEVADTK